MRFFGNERDTTDRDDRGDEEPRDRVVTDEERPDHVRSAPVPVQRSAPQGVEAIRDGEAALEEQARGEDLTRLAAPHDRDTDRRPGRDADEEPGRVPEDALTDRGTFEDPVAAGERRDEAGTADPGDLHAADGTGVRAADGMGVRGAGTRDDDTVRMDVREARTRDDDIDVPIAAAAGADDGPGPVRVDRRGTADADREADRNAGTSQAAGFEEPALGERRGADDGDGADEAAGDGRPFGGSAAAAAATIGSAASGTTSGQSTTGQSTAADRAERRTPEEQSLRDGGTFEDPVVVEPGGPARTFAATDAAQLPGGAGEPEVGPLFTDADAHGFRDRWREVQLRFVDDPKGAADEAASLVDEVVETLTTALRAQHAKLGEAEATDTEQLRVRIRGYRSFFDRLLAL